MKTTIYKYYFALLVILVAGNISYAACPPNTNFTSTVTAASCPTNGSVTINSTDPSSYVYELVQGPVGFPTGTTNSPSFSSLAPGSYRVKISCRTDLAQVYYHDFTISNTYVNVTGSASSVPACQTNNAGTITANVLSGTGPFRYAFWIGNPNEPDANLTFSSSNSFVAPTFGNYNIRVLDACNFGVTSQYSFVNPYDGLHIGFVAKVPSFTGPRACNASFDSLHVGLQVGAVTVPYSSLPGPGITVEVYTFTGDCANPGILTPQPAFTQVISPSTSDYIRVPSNTKFMLRMVTPCYIVDSFCVADVNFFKPRIRADWAQTACKVGANAPLITIGVVMDNYGTLPFNYYFVKPNNDTAFRGSSNNYLLELNGMAEYGQTYFVTVVDACGNVIRDTINTVGENVPVSVDASVDQSLLCTSETGKISTTLLVNGFLPGLSYDSTTFTIIAGPDNINERAIKVSGNTYRYLNLSPNATYTARIVVKNCSNASYDVTFTTPRLVVELQQSITAFEKQFCSGGGNIDINTTYNGWGSASVYLVDVNTNLAVGPYAGANIVIPNIPPGLYRPELRIQLQPECPITSYSINADTVRLLPANSGGITRSVSMVCNYPTQNNIGSMQLFINGIPPYRIEYKLGNGPLLLHEIANTTGKSVIGNLVPNSTYDFTVTDSCGTVSTLNATILPLEPIRVSEAFHPCLNEAFSVSVPEFVNATYLWKKGNTTVGSTRLLQIPNFTSSNSGIYTCEVIIDNCVRQVVEVTLYLELCDEPITNVKLGGNVFNDGNGLTDNFVNGIGTNINGSLVVTLLDKFTNNVISNVFVNNDGSYKFGSLPPGDYDLVLGTSFAIEGTIFSNAVLPNDYVYTGENIGLPTVQGSDGIVDGRITVTLANVDIDNVNFGIDKRPESIPYATTLTSSPIYNSSLSLTLANNLQHLSATDLEDGTIDIGAKIKITDLNNMNGNELYYDGVLLTTNTEINSYDFSKLEVKFLGVGTTTFEFEFAVFDAAGVIDLTPAKYTVDWGVPLPLHLLDFEVQNLHNIHKVTFVTANEINHKGTYIQYSSNNSVWENITWLTNDDAKVKGLNNYYEYDNKHFRGATHYYRLAFVDGQGQVMYSTIQFLMTKSNTYLVNPNPFVDVIAVDNLNAGDRVELINSIGQSVYSQDATHQMLQIDTRKMTSGVYILRINGISIKKLVK